MHKEDGRVFVMEGDGTSFLSCSFDGERDEMKLTCPACGCSDVVSAAAGLAALTLEHEHDCQLLTLIENLASQEDPDGK